MERTAWIWVGPSFSVHYLSFTNTKGIIIMTKWCALLVKRLKGKLGHFYEMPFASKKKKKKLKFMFQLVFNK
jgi:hypothetical protein